MSKEEVKWNNIRASPKMPLRRSRATSFIQDLVEEFVESAISFESWNKEYKQYRKIVKNVRFVHDDNVTEILPMEDYLLSLKNDESDLVNTTQIMPTKENDDFREDNVSKSLGSSKVENATLVNKKPIPRSNQKKVLNVNAVSKTANTSGKDDQEMLVNETESSTSFQTAIEDGETRASNNSVELTENEKVETMEIVEDDNTDNFEMLNLMLKEKLHNIEKELNSQKSLNDKQSNVIQQQMLMAYKQKHDAYKCINISPNVIEDDLKIPENLKKINQNLERLEYAFRFNSNLQKKSKILSCTGENAIESNDIAADVMDLKISIKKLVPKCRAILDENSHLRIQNKLLSEEICNAKSKFSMYVRKYEKVLKALKLRKRNAWKAKLNLCDIEKPKKKFKSTRIKNHTDNECAKNHEQVFPNSSKELISVEKSVNENSMFQIEKFLNHKSQSNLKTNKKAKDECDTEMRINTKNIKQEIDMKYCWENDKDEAIIQQMFRQDLSIGMPAAKKERL